MTVFDPDATRELLERALPEDTSGHGSAPEPRYLYVPLRHIQALSPDHGLVVGIRGAGKSVWWAALQSDEHRQVIGATLPNRALDEVSLVSAGFGEQNRPDDYPDKRIIKDLLERRIPSVDIWRTVIAWNTWGRAGGMPGGSWLEKTSFVVGDSETVARSFKAYDDRIADTGGKHLVLFDALDVAAREWADLRELLRGLLEALLEFRAYRSIRAKAFVRPDMLEDSAVTSFRDASKILAGRVELRWSRADLYGLLFQHLGNAALGEDFRRGCETLGSGRWDQLRTVWEVPKKLREDGDLQRRVFDDIGGKWMGRDRRRGFPYTWLPNHLADAAEQVSPRSFLSAIRAAAESSRSKPYEYALHYEGIKTGVTEASRIRVAEVQEDFFWVPTLMNPLKGLVIPCDFAEILGRWERAGVIDALRTLASTRNQLLPKHIDEGLSGLRQDLLDLALFSEQRDGRINMPDVYRVGFGLGRMGGIKPIR